MLHLFLHNCDFEGCFFDYVKFSNERELDEYLSKNRTTIGETEIYLIKGDMICRDNIMKILGQNEYTAAQLKEIIKPYL